MTSPYAKAALFTIRLVACGLMIISLALYSTDIFLYLSHHYSAFSQYFSHEPPPSGTVMLVLKGIPMVLGLAVCIKSKALAVHLTKDLE